MVLLATLFRLAVGCYFVKAGADKKGHPSAFWNAIMGYRLVGAKTSRYMASLVPPLEFFAGLMLAANILPISLSPWLVVRNAVLGLMLVPVLVGGMGSPASEDLVVSVVSLAAVLVIAVLRNRVMAT